MPHTPNMYVKGDPTQLNASDWTLYDKVTYGGLGYGAFVLPSNFFIIIVTCIFPPLGQLIHIMGDTIISTPPYFTIDSLKNILNYDNIITLIYSIILTTLFYVPGLIYVLGNIVKTETSNQHMINMALLMNNLETGDEFKKREAIINKLK